ncbi:ankyrin repeat and protein kinase domain-containing protein 1 isoform X2 [Esox lucius]|uniref:ankyrin repeat and protein kinase domain-containing protein 1 isoform X2 n=1 Tax=Esox lucius TaxID=8010 RepID=UPI0014770016|nr:ankyrin repeat and protein kinase domain-containing protein 1 isoform X2 [Esox lucius]
MDSIDGAVGKFRIFKKDDFEADWIKLKDRSFGQVYRVKLKLWREKCALKSFSTNLTGSNFYRRMIEEASNMEKAKFRYIVSIYGVCNEPPAIVMEYMSNGSLDRLLTSHTLMWPKKFQMIHEVAMGMNFLHSLSPPLLHLNLKPSNVLLDDHLHVKISDFGFIKWDETGSKKELVENLTLRGNICYIPPELFTQCPEGSGTKFDVYSFSIVMWEILTQKKPYQGSTTTTVLMKVTLGRRPGIEMIPDDKPRECDQMVKIMQECWDQDPGERPEFSDTVRKTEALNDILGLGGCRSGMEAHIPAYPKLSPSCRRKSTYSLTDPLDSNTGDGILHLLSKKDFDGFRQTLSKEHVSMLFKDNNTLLHYAVVSGDTKSVADVLSLGAEVNSQSVGGNTPLAMAVLYKFSEVCSLLTERGADIHLSDGDKWTPLHFAAQNGDSRVVRLFLDRGASPGVKEKDGWTPLHLASQNGHEAVVRLLLSRLGSADEQEEIRGRTALHIASAYGHVGIAKLLLGKGVDPNGTDNSQATGLHLAAEEGHYRVARELVKNGADVNSVDNRRYTPLHFAAIKGHTGICRLLLGNRANPDPRTLQGWTPMHLAALKGHGASLLELEAHRASVDIQGPAGWTPLHLACHHRQEEVVSMLLAAKADPDATEDRGCTALHLACNGALFPGVLQLISHGANVNVRNRSQSTPLHLAAQNGSVPIIKALLLNGADRSAEDLAGCTALTLARRCQKEEAALLLQDC